LSCRTVDDFDGASSLLGVPCGDKLGPRFVYYTKNVWRSTTRLDGTASKTTIFRHATEHPLVVVDLDPDADPPKQLAIGPDPAGNLLEVVVLTLIEEQLLAVHAMPLREKYFYLLPGGDNPDG
jgi:hypothetical protein